MVGRKALAAPLALFCLRLYPSLPLLSATAWAVLYCTADSRTTVATLGDLQGAMERDQPARSSWTSPGTSAACLASPFGSMVSRPECLGGKVWPVFPSDLLNLSSPAPFAVCFALPLLWALLHRVWRTSFKPDAAALLFTFLLRGPVLSLTVIIHELAHALAARHSGCGVHAIVL